MTTALADAPPRGAAVWAELSIPVVTPDGWERPEILEGIRQLERLSRQGAAAMAALVAALGDGRDRASAVRRATGASRRQTKRRLRIADTIGALPEAGLALAAGQVSEEHLAVLAPIAAITGAEDLVEDAKRCDPDELERRVRRFQLDHEGDDLTSRQRAARGVTFFPAEHANLGVRGVFTPLEGELIHNRLAAIADQMWRENHPERADTTTAAGDPSYAQRLADAFMSLIYGTAPASGKPAVVIVVDADTLHADMAGTGPVSLDDTAETAARAEVYAAIRDTATGQLNLGRSRRLATALQRLAMIVRDGSHCVYPGCSTHWRYTQAHHLTPDTHGGPTNLHNLAHLCPAHHRHLHLNHQTLTRQPDGTYHVTNHDSTPLDTG